MKKVLLSLTTVALLFAACKKDDDNKTTIVEPPVYGTIKVKDSTWTTNFAFVDNSGDNTTSFGVFTNNVLDPNFSGQSTGIQITLNKIIEGNTFTWIASDEDPDYDPAKNFFDAEAYFKVKFPDAIDDDNLPGVMEDVVSGSVTIQKFSKDSLNFTYSLVFPNDSTVTGKYAGAYKTIQP